MQLVYTNYIIYCNLNYIIIPKKEKEKEKRIYFIVLFVLS